ncbi:phosphatase 1 regulatory subunit 3C-like protein, partial [Euroglyphus maynei]
MPPLAAFKSLQLDDEDRDWLLQNRSIHQPSFNMNSHPIAKKNEMQATMRMLFVQPSSDPLNFMERVRANKICLENCLLSGPTGSNHVFKINCIVRVLNVCFQKQVILRYTTNEWLTWTEVPATYVPNSNDGFSDKFAINFEMA